MNLKISLRQIFAIFFALNFNQANAVVYTAPRLEEEKLSAYLQALINEHPGLSQVSQKAGSYSHIIAHEQQLLPKLHSFSGYAEMATQKPELQTLTFSVKTKGELQYTLKEEAFLNRRAELLAYVKSKQALSAPHNPEGTLFTGVAERLSKIFGELNGKDPRGMITGLINTLPPEERTRFFKMGDPELQIAALEEESSLTDQRIQASFRGSEFNIDERDLTRATLLALIKDKVRLQKEAIVASRLLAYSAGSTYRVGKPRRSWAQSFDELITFISEETDPQTLSFGTKDIKEAPVHSWLKGGAPVTSFFDRLIDNQNRKEFVSRTVYPDPRPFRIVEQPPNVGILRSSISHDCSTTNSWAFPYSPMEREYFIYLPDGKFAGHVGATQVYVDGVKTLYLHDVKGAQLSPTVGSWVLHAFQLAAVDLGFEQISIATERQTNLTNNSPEMKEILAARRGVEVAQTYPDAELRTKLLAAQPDSELTYDQPNQAGHLFSPDPEIQQQIRRLGVSFQPRLSQPTIGLSEAVKKRIRRSPPKAKEQAKRSPRKRA